MNKRDLVSRVASRAMLTQKQSAKAVDSMLEAIVAAVASGESVKLSGFGTFGVQHRQSRKGRHPQTGMALKIPPKSTPTFSASRLFKSKVSDQLYVLRIPPLSQRPQRAVAPSQSALSENEGTVPRLRSITEKLVDFFQ